MHGEGNHGYVRSLRGCLGTWSFGREQGSPCYKIRGGYADALLAVVCFSGEVVPTGWFHDRVEGTETVIEGGGGWA